MLGKIQILAGVTALFLFACSILPASAATIDGRDLTVQGSERPVKVRVFSIPGVAPRPAVLLLHGAGAMDPLGAGFTSYIDSLTANGMDAYVVFYYSDADMMLMGSSEHSVRAKTVQTRIEAWAKLVGDVASFALRRPESNGRVGALGISNGATLGVAAAARDARILALVACYGSFPPIENVRRLPPMLILQGDADQVIPPIAGKELINYVKAIGGNAQLVSYPGAGHGFDLNTNPSNVAGADARRRAILFLTHFLGVQ
jgi:carboxymethylenebutenolidase